MPASFRPRRLHRPRDDEIGAAAPGDASTGLTIMQQLYVIIAVRLCSGPGGRLAGRQRHTRGRDAPAAQAPRRRAHARRARAARRGLAQRDTPAHHRARARRPGQAGRPQAHGPAPVARLRPDDARGRALPPAVRPTGAEPPRGDRRPPRSRGGRGCARRDGRGPRPRVAARAGAPRPRGAQGARRHADERARLPRRPGRGRRRCPGRQLRVPQRRPPQPGRVPLRRAVALAPPRRRGAPHLLHGPRRRGLRLRQPEGGSRGGRGLTPCRAPPGGTHQDPTPYRLACARTADSPLPLGGDRERGAMLDLALAVGLGRAASARAAGLVLAVSVALQAPLGAAAQPAAPATTDVVLVLDASGSMFNELADGRYRITAAKEALATFVSRLPDDPSLSVGLRVYGSRLAALDQGACEDSLLTVPLAPLDRDLLL